jgi:hypothetical protein
MYRRRGTRTVLSAYAHASSDTVREMEQTKKKLDTGHTRNGLLILTISYSAIAVLTAASIINFLLGLLIAVADLSGIVGGVLIFIGRDSFGRRHSRNTILSVLIYAVAIVTIIVGKIVYGAELVLNRIPNGTIVYGNTTSSAVNPYIILYATGAIAAALIGLAIVFLTFSLHRKTGRIILSIAYIGFLALTILTTALIFQGIATMSSLTIDPSTPQQIHDQYEILQLLSIVPNLAFAFTFYLALRRIEKRELPESPMMAETGTRRI